MNFSTRVVGADLICSGLKNGRNITVLGHIRWNLPKLDLLLIADKEGASVIINVLVRGVVYGISNSLDVVVLDMDDVKAVRVFITRCWLVNESVALCRAPLSDSLFANLLEELVASDSPDLE